MTVAMLAACETAEPDPIAPDVVGRWTYAEWSFEDGQTGAVQDYLTTKVASGAVEIAPDSSILIEEFALWVGGQYHARLVGAASLADDVLTLTFPSGTRQYDVIDAGNELVLERLGPVVPPLGDMAASVETIALTPTASLPDLTGRIAFAAAASGQQSDVWVMNGDGTARARLTDDPAADFAPAWSPDGARIVFVSNRDGNLEIYVMNADGSQQERVTTDPGSDRDPDWSPDGEIVFSRSSTGMPTSLYRITPGQPEATLLRPGEDPGFNHAEPAWSSDGSRIAFVRSMTGGPSAIYGMTGEGTDLAPIAETGPGAIVIRRPAWSPSGRLAYTASDHYATLMVEDGNPLAGGRQPSEPAWAGEDAVLFISFGDLYIVRRNGGGIANLTRSPDLDESGPDWAP